MLKLFNANIYNTKTASDLTDQSDEVDELGTDNYEEVNLEDL